jgi:streptogramin lyase
MRRPSFLILLLIAAPAIVAAQSGTQSNVLGYLIPGSSYAEEIAAGPDGGLWFADYSAFIGRITTAGALSTYQVSSRVRTS